MKTCIELIQNSITFSLKKINFVKWLLLLPCILCQASTYKIVNATEVRGLFGRFYRSMGILSLGVGLNFKVLYKF